jgi:ubiquinone/menaquinone biosynthesis C-methylase UbiE
MEIMSDENIKQSVREFYDQVGWQEVSEGVYQNARYEDLRPVSRDYIHKCHLRVKRHLPKKGEFLLDAGSGPIQYPEYVTYSDGYNYRVCADISIQALTEARKRVGDHGLMVVADVANLPFSSEIFAGVVSLHTIHHLPLDEHPQAYSELYRVMKTGCTAVVVNGWHKPPLGVALDRLRKFTLRVRGFINHRILRRKAQISEGNLAQAAQAKDETKSTFVEKNNAAWLKQNVGTQIPIEIRIWRSVSVKVLRTFVHDGWGGRGILRLLFWLEERFPHWFGKNGQYPLVIVSKPE